MSRETGTAMVEALTFKKDEIREQASCWLVRMEDPDVDGRTVQSLLSWLDKNPEHRIEFFEMAHMWGNMDVLSELAEIMPLQAPYKTREPVAERPGFVWPRSFALVASLCVALFLGAFFVADGSWQNTFGASDAIYTTAIGEQKSISLADGSRIKINTDSIVRVVYSSSFRRIYLESGEAHFEVEKDVSRPFVVHAGTGSVTAVGTAFTVQYRESSVRVLVTEGTVGINASVQSSVSTNALSSPAEITERENTILTAGQVAEFDDVILAIDTVETEELDRKLAWQRGILIFNGEYLEEAVKEVTRYTHTKIVIDDADVRKVKVGGYFRTGEIEPMLAALERSFGIDVNRVEENLIHLSKKRKPDVKSGVE